MLQRFNSRISAALLRLASALSPSSLATTGDNPAPKNPSERKFPTILSVDEIDEIGNLRRACSVYQRSIRALETGNIYRLTLTLDQVKSATNWSGLTTIDFSRINESQYPTQDESNTYPNTTYPRRAALEERARALVLEDIRLQLALCKSQLSMYNIDLVTTEES